VAKAGLINTFREVRFVLARPPLPARVFVSYFFRRSKENLMNRRSIFTLSTAALLFWGAFSNARADETLKYRSVTHVTNVQTIDAGDVDGYLLGVNRQSGIASFPDGSVATTSSLL
jgi:hypothetical protein